jgi:hypothetical protein
MAHLLMPVNALTILPRFDGHGQASDAGVRARQKYENLDELLQDSVHLRMQALQLALAHLVDLARRHVRGGRGLERPPVEFFAVWTCRDSRIVRRPGSLGLQFAYLPLECRRDLQTWARLPIMMPIIG